MDGSVRATFRLMSKQRAPESLPIHPLKELSKSVSKKKLTSLRYFAQLAGKKGFEECGSSYFASQLEQKLEDNQYSDPNSRRNGPTFAKVLQRAGVRQVLMGAPVITEVEMWVTLRNVLAQDQKAQLEGMSIERLPIQFHKKLFAELGRHFTALACLIGGNPDFQDALQSHTHVVWRELRRQFVALHAFYTREDWRKLLNEENLTFRPRDPEVSISVRVYLLLRHTLQNAKTRKLGISDQFLRALTLLILGRRTVSDDSLRQALTERR